MEKYPCKALAILCPLTKKNLFLNVKYRQNVEICNSDVTLVHLQILAIKYRLIYGVSSLEQIHTGLH